MQLFRQPANHSEVHHHISNLYQFNSRHHLSFTLLGNIWQFLLQVWGIQRGCLCACACACVCKCNSVSVMNVCDVNGVIIALWSSTVTQHETDGRNFLSERKKCVFMCLWVCVRVRVCVRERERERGMCVPSKYPECVVGGGECFGCSASFSRC